MEYNYIQMAGHAVAYMIALILQHIIDCITPMASQILSFKASIVSGLLGRNTYLWRHLTNNSPTV